MNPPMFKEITSVDKNAPDPHVSLAKVSQWHDESVAKWQKRIRYRLISLVMLTIGTMLFFGGTTVLFIQMNLGIIPNTILGLGFGITLGLLVSTIRSSIKTVHYNISTIYHDGIYNENKFVRKAAEEYAVLLGDYLTNSPRSPLRGVFMDVPDPGTSSGELN